ncbi:MAG: phosphotransferase family protein [Rudaea sp.]|uniref:phosphotransferase family protein n=1 Tax=Rudaea sp. TaxID=2136325 RepID=UPI0039E269E4
MSAPDATLADESLLRERLQAYLQKQTRREWNLGSFTRYAVGFSWITYGFGATEQGQPERGLILRLGPPYGLFAPYSALPQHAALKVLEDSGVPTPRSYWWSDDASILGAPFFISERVAGSAPVPWVSQNGSGFEDAYRLKLGTQFVSALAGLHNCEWHGRPGFENDGTTVENAALRQVEEWERNQARWALKPYPMLTWAFRWLRAHLPRAPRVSLVHGDYRLGNFLERDGCITAILDWELVHPGDPHEDSGLGFFAAIQRRFRAGLSFVAQGRFHPPVRARSRFQGRSGRVAVLHRVCAGQAGHHPYRGGALL